MGIEEPAADDPKEAAESNLKEKRQEKLGTSTTE